MMEKKPITSSLRMVGGQLLDARQAAIEAQGQGPHRMEMVLSVDGVSYINDSISTFLDATLEALGNMDQRVVWITGAWSDEMTQSHVVELMEERVSAVVLFGPVKEVQGKEDAQVFHAKELRTAVFLARELAKDGEAVLFSPACPSGNGFANYEERGAEFKRAVRDL
ncbi:MAG: hypothetical protein WAR83_07475 [Flavobacteriales bacterium]